MQLFCNFLFLCRGGNDFGIAGDHTKMLPAETVRLHVIEIVFPRTYFLFRLLFKPNVPGQHAVMSV